jgi:hypothetical protein
VHVKARIKTQQKVRTDVAYECMSCGTTSGRMVGKPEVMARIVFTGITSA